MTKYRTITADPPWKYGDRIEHTGAGAELHYPCMDVASICALPIGGQAEPDAHLYLWVTNSFMEEGYQVARAWGFEPKTIVTWVKSGLGLGHYFRNTTEHFLFCTRGKLPRQKTDLPTHFAAATSGHSRKPRAFYQIVEMMSPGPYLEVFARARRDGWDAFGNQVEAETALELPLNGE